MKLLAIIFVISFAVTSNCDLFEGNESQRKELRIIEAEAKKCVTENEASENCQYKCALHNLHYNSTTFPHTSKASTICNTITATIDDECFRMRELVYCLRQEVQKEVNALKLACYQEFQPFEHLFRNVNTSVIIKDQRSACFMFCMQKAFGVLDDDFNVLLDPDFTGNTNINIPQALVECKNLSEEETKCSTSAFIFNCLEEKIKNAQ